jgi:hypothetical protein
MNTKGVIEDIPVFQQKMFEMEPEPDISNRTLQYITHQRGQRLTKEKTSDLISPGSYELSVDEDKLSRSNTRFVFKNLYGETLLTFLFFSEQNILNIQNLIKFNVNKEIGYVIDNQSMAELLIIMRAIFLEYSFHPELLKEDMPKEKKDELLVKYTNEVDRLNKIVIDQIVPKLISQIQQYIDYLRDASQQPYQMDQPKNPSIQGERQYRSVTQVLMGGDF